MATGTKYTRAEALVGVMVTFCLGLFFLMMLLYGNISRFWRGRRVVTVFFTQVTGLRPDAPVRLNGVEVGRVKDIVIIRLGRSEIERLKPAVNLKSLRDLPLTVDESKRLRERPESQRIEAALGIIEGRTMVELTMEVLEEADPERYRVDDLVEIVTTLMGDVSVQISSGFGAALKGNYVLLGRSGDLMSNLAEGIGDVRDVLADIRDVIGPQEKAEIRETIQNIRDSTQDLRRVASEMLVLMQDGRARLNSVARQAEESLAAVERQVEGLGPKARETLGEVDRTLVSMRNDAHQGVATAEKALEQYRELAISVDQHVVQNVGSLIQENRGNVRELLSGLNDLNRDLRQSASHLTALLMSSQEFLSENRPDLRYTFISLRGAADNIEQATFRIKRRPWELLKAPSGEDQTAELLADYARRLELTSRALQDTIDELRVIKGTGGPASQQQLERIENLLKELQLIREQTQSKERTKPPAEFERKAGGEYFKREP